MPVIWTDFENLVSLNNKICSRSINLLISPNEIYGFFMNVSQILCSETFRNHCKLKLHLQIYHSFKSAIIFSKIPISAYQDNTCMNNPNWESNPDLFFFQKCSTIELFGCFLCLIAKISHIFFKNIRIGK